MGSYISKNDPSSPVGFIILPKTKRQKIPSDSPIDVCNEHTKEGVFVHKKKRRAAVPRISISEK